ncbi:hypothetical protein HOLleu_28622 [Holothuria leucospilota]|uniref:Uncharacterized protein n=1 Tax=Holothuria leucospilota TaxID=206669 RepID=A0A9Q1BM50_HOLLE|nr:hypothetical protein HOLleu_28622 [Holothuria leucospilota]
MGTTRQGCHSPPTLPDNCQFAHSRLRQLKRRQQGDETLYEQYKITMNDYIEKGYEKEVEDDQKNAESGPVWYPPHHPVKHPVKPEKV